MKFFQLNVYKLTSQDNWTKTEFICLLPIEVINSSWSKVFPIFSAMWPEAQLHTEANDRLSTYQLSHMTSVYQIVKSYIKNKKNQAPALLMQSFLLPFSPSGAGQCKCKRPEYPLVEIPHRHRIPGAPAVRLHFSRKHRLRRQHPHCNPEGD